MLHSKTRQQMAASKGEAEKYGFFGEPSYTTIGDPYKPPFVLAFTCFLLLSPRHTLRP